MLVMADSDSVHFAPSEVSVAQPWDQFRSHWLLLKAETVFAEKIMRSGAEILARFGLH